jgi:hypothetical protein
VVLDEEEEEESVDPTGVGRETRTRETTTETETETETTTTEIDPTVDIVVADNDDAFLGGEFVEIGVAANGTMGTETAIPGSFGASAHSAVGGLSFFFNTAGTGDANPQSGDAFLPGSPVETFSLGFTDGTGTFLSHNENEGQFTGIPMAFDSVETNADGTSVVTDGGIAGRMDVSQSVTLNGDDSFYTTAVTLTNVSGGAMSNVRYMRNNDPDQDAESGGSFSTINDVLLNPNSPGIAAVNAQGQTGGQNIMLLADQTTMNVDNGFAQDTIEVRASAFGFENTNPFANSAFDNPADPNGATGDIGINLVFAVSSLAAGQSVTFSWITSINASTDGNDVMAALIGQTSLDGGAGDDVMYASQATTTETLVGSDGDDTLVAYSTGITNGDVLVGGDGMDRLIDGEGVDTFTGGGGVDSFVFYDADALHEIAGNTAFDPATLPKVDEITDFTSGTDTLEFVSSAFGNLAIGALTNGVNFSVIDGGYDGTNAGVNLNHGLGLSSFVYSKSDGVLFYDDNGSGAGYQAVAEVGQPGASDIEIVAAA